MPWTGPLQWPSCSTIEKQPEKFVAEVKQRDLGISVNVSTSVEGAQVCCYTAGVTRHSVEYSLGFQGQLDRLPSRHVLELSTMLRPRDGFLQPGQKDD